MQMCSKTEFPFREMFSSAIDCRGMVELVCKLILITWEMVLEGEGPVLPSAFGSFYLTECLTMYFTSSPIHLGLKASA